MKKKILDKPYPDVPVRDAVQFVCRQCGRSELRVLNPQEMPFVYCRCGEQQFLFTTIKTK